MIAVFNHALMITGFVFVMMLVIEYVNVLTSGSWQNRLAASRWGQYVFAALMGSIPGCLGAFIVVAMYSHGMLSLGAVVAAMIATSGDESFVMLAMIPDQALRLMVILFIVGIIAGMLADLFFRRYKSKTKAKCEGFEVHTFESCHCFPRDEIWEQWKHPSPFRTALIFFLSLFLLAIIAGQLGPSQWNWVRISILLVTVSALFIIITVPDHFLEEHLWGHIARKHAPRIFLWTFGTLLIMHLVVDQFNLTGIIRENEWTVLAIASLVGIIPESGPHLMFVTLFDNGTVPFGILLASSIVQDGHGMLPMLAHSGKDFVIIKLINLVTGIIIGAVALMAGC